MRIEKAGNSERGIGNNDTLRVPYVWWAMLCLPYDGFGFSPTPHSPFPTPGKKKAELSAETVPLFSCLIFINNRTDMFAGQGPGNVSLF